MMQHHPHESRALFGFCQCLAICLPICQALADTVAGHPDAPGQTQKVAVVEGPVILRAAANAAVRDAYAGAAGELVWSAESPYDWRLHAGDGKGGGWSVFRDYILPLWENRWISWGDNVADATGELRMHGHPVALNGAWTVRATDILAFSYGTNVVAYFGLPASGGGGGRILDYGIEGDVHTVTCTYIEGDAARPVLQATTDLAEGEWAAVPDVTTNRIDPSTVALVHTNAGSNAFFRVLWTEGIPSGLTVRGDVTAAGFTLAGTTVTNWPDITDSIEARVDELAEQADEYWCQWAAASLAPGPATNWIPTHWPARNVRCYIRVTEGSFGANELIIAIPTSFASQVDRKLTLFLSKGSGVTGFRLCTGIGAELFSVSSSTASYRLIVMEWAADMMQWFVHGYTIATVPYAISSTGSRQYPDASLPADERFAPVILEEPAAALSASPSLPAEPEDIPLEDI